MSDNYRKQLPPGNLDLSLSPSAVRRTPAPRLPEVQQPMSGRRGRELANEVRAKLFNLWWQMVIDQLAQDSIAIVTRHGQQVINDAISEMLDLYLNNERHPAANAIMKEVTEMSIRAIVAGIRTIVESHTGRIGGIL